MGANPGPWRWTKSDHFSSPMIGTLVDADGVPLIEYVGHERAILDFTSVDVARLIEAAPEILALLRRTFDPFGTGRIHDRANCPICDEDRGEDDPACLQASAARLLARLPEAK